MAIEKFGNTFTPFWKWLQSRTFPYELDDFYFNWTFGFGQTIIVSLEGYKLFEINIDSIIVNEINANDKKHFFIIRGLNNLITSEDIRAFIRYMEDIRIRESNCKIYQKFRHKVNPKLEYCQKTGEFGFGVVNSKR